MSKTLRRLLGLGLLAGAAYALWRKLPTRAETGTHWESQPFPFPPQPVIEQRGSAAPVAVPDAVEAPTAVDETAWVDPVDSGACPAHHPVKAKLASGIFHVPGGANYTRTKADRCYVSADAAEADGLRPSKN